MRQSRRKITKVTLLNIQIMSLGNAIDFGDLTVTGGEVEIICACSNGHGGLG